MRRLLFRLRPEEAVALAFVLPTTWLTVAAYLYARGAGVLGPRYPGGVVRLAVVVALLAGLALALRRSPASPLVRGLRETVPLLACFLIYTNLHDTIGFVNPHDVHHWLVALDAQIFGVQPCVWAERFITPALTERVDGTSNQRLIVADLTLAPLAQGEYAIEVIVERGDQKESASYAFRIVP
jgi:hypothetical protein